MQINTDIMNIAEQKIQQAVQDINNGKAEQAVEIFIQAQLICIKLQESSAFKQITAVLNSLYQQVGEPVYQHLTAQPIQDILDHGITWDGILVLEASEAEAILEKLNTIVE